MKCFFWLFLLTVTQVRIDNFCLGCEDDAFKAAAGYKQEEKAFEVQADYQGWIYNAN